VEALGHGQEGVEQKRGTQRLRRYFLDRWREKRRGAGPCMEPHDERSRGARSVTAGSGRSAPTRERWAWAVGGVSSKQGRASR
jgi:hypothetical protein